ncbi:MAG TPA: hypothetical protein VIJ37_01180 [Steroidobacteraceae bacterium]
MHKSPILTPVNLEIFILEAVMQDAVVGSWAQESYLSPERLGSLHELNHRFLDLAGARAAEWGITGGGGVSLGLAERVAPLSRTQRSAAANCPYALFDLRFEDDRHWLSRLENVDEWRIADESVLGNDTHRFVHMALFYAWHVASGAGLGAQLLLGMNDSTAAAFRRVNMSRLSALAATEAAHLTARWSGCSPYWVALMSAAARSDPAGLRRVQLYGLQLAAAARLSAF